MGEQYSGTVYRAFPYMIRAGKGDKYPVYLLSSAGYGSAKYKTPFKTGPKAGARSMPAFVPGGSCDE
jgi:hypothetical protein